MKIKPEIFLRTKKNIDYKKILITGTDESFISYVRDYISDSFIKRNFYIDVSGNYNPGMFGNLFSDKKTLFLLNDSVDTKIIGDLNESDEQYLLIACPNGKKANTIKKIFTNQKNSLILECYTLNRGAKEIILKYFVEEKKVTLSHSVFWYVVENFNDNYVFFIKQLETLILFDKKINLISDVENIVFVGNKINLNKIFFNIFSNNKILTDVYNKNVISVSDFYIFLNSIKFYLEIITNSSNKEIALTKFPKYLFAEKDIFLKIYNCLNKSKLSIIYNNLARVEALSRKHSNLYNMIGLRFFLSIKKTIIF